jgi:uncharacterized delta-60 repeat protein
MEVHVIRFDSASMLRSDMDKKMALEKTARRAALRRAAMRGAALRATPTAAGAVAAFERLESRQLLSGTVTISGAPTTNEGADYTLNLSSQNVSPPIDHWTIHWGDGTSTVPGNPSTADHFYADGPNQYTITATATLTDNSTIDANQSTATVVQNGALDPSFGTGGKVLTGIAGSDRGIVVQSNGDIIQVVQSGNTVTIARFNPDGSADTTFGNSGSVTYGDPQVGFGSVAKVMLQTITNPYGSGTVERLVIAGSSTSVAQPHSRIWRLNLDNGAGNPADGTFDTLWANGGIFDAPPVLNTSDFIAGNDVMVDAATDSQGRIVFLTRANRNLFNDNLNSPYIAVGRVLANGSGIDTSYGGDGEANPGFEVNRLPNTTTDTNNNTSFALLLGADDSAYGLTLGHTDADPSSRNYFAKFDPSGHIDNSFGPGGFVEVNQNAILSAMAFDGNGHILLTGESSNSLAVARYNLDGSPDLGFGSGGISVQSIDLSSSGNSVTPTADGKIIVGGSVSAFFTGPFLGNTNAFVARLTSGGTLDTGFGTASSGVTRVDFQSGEDSAKQIVVLPNAQILMTSNSTDSTNTNNFADLARFNPVQASATPVVVTVNNVAPTAGAIAASSPKAVRYQSVTFSDTFTDPGILDTHTIVWNFGDGSPTVTTNLAANVLTGSAAHVYTVAGPYTITATITDKDGGHDMATRSFSVDVVDLQPDPANPALTALFVGGTPGDDNIVINPGTNVMQAIVNCVAYQNLNPTGRIVVFGGDGNDMIQVAGGITSTTELYGGNGNDRIKGGNGYNIEVGGAGDDVLVGGNTRDLLIGGAGGDSLTGGAGDDVLIAMSTQYDGNELALESIQNEWIRTDLGFSDRVNHLLHGGGFNGTNVLSSATTFDDGATDVLTGSSGSDAFFFDNGDIVTDAGKTDAAIDLSWVTV